MEWGEIHFRNEDFEARVATLSKKSLLEALSEIWGSCMSCVSEDLGFSTPMNLYLRWDFILGVHHGLNLRAWECFLKYTGKLTVRHAASLREAGSRELGITGWWLLGPAGESRSCCCKKLLCTTPHPEG